MLGPGEGAVIEIPRRYQRIPIIIMRRKAGELAQMRAEDHFLPASKDPPPQGTTTVIKSSPISSPQPSIKTSPHASLTVQPSVAASNCPLLQVNILKSSKV